MSEKIISLPTMYVHPDSVFSLFQGHCVGVAPKSCVIVFYSLKHTAWLEKKSYDQPKFLFVCPIIVCEIYVQIYEITLFVNY